LQKTNQLGAIPQVAQKKQVFVGDPVRLENNLTGFIILAGNKLTNRLPANFFSGEILCS